MNEPALALEARTARAVYQATGGESVVQALIKLLPAGRGAPRLPLHVTILIERGPGMAQEGRLEAVVQAVRAALDVLAPTDWVSIATYGDRGKLVLSAEALGDGLKARRLLGFLDAQQVGEGAALLAGMKAMAEDVAARPGAAWARRVLLFTASPSTPAVVLQEGDVEVLARGWAEAGVGIAVFGLGAAWNASFLTRLADVARGSVRHVARLAELAPLVRAELAEPLVLADVRLRMRFARGVRLRRFMQVFPAVAHWLPLQPSDREAVARVGELSGDRPSYLLAELVIPRQAPNTLRLATIEAIFTSASGRQGSAPPVDLVVAFGPEASGSTPEAARQEEAFQAYALVERALEARRAQQPERARTFLANARPLAGDRPLARPLDEALGALTGGLPFTDTMAIGLLMAARHPDERS
ncbi:MAG: von Willebrand factor type [Cyanobacteria bacterium RYN_339]|nr:von Willebrand factor type [Cyanobacteria bacterium RYN_339]